MLPKVADITAQQSTNGAGRLGGERAARHGLAATEQLRGVEEARRTRGDICSDPFRRNWFFPIGGTVSPVAVSPAPPLHDAPLPPSQGRRPARQVLPPRLKKYIKSAS